MTIATTIVTSGIAIGRVLLAELIGHARTVQRDCSANVIITFDSEVDRLALISVGRQDALHRHRADTGFRRDLANTEPALAQRTNPLAARPHSASWDGCLPRDVTIPISVH